MTCDFWKDIVNASTGCEQVIDVNEIQYGYVGSPHYWGNNGSYNDTFFFNQVDAPVFDIIASEGMTVELNGFVATLTTFSGKVAWESVSGSRILRVVVEPGNYIWLHYKLAGISLGGSSVHYINVVVKDSSGTALFDATASLDWRGQMLSVSNATGHLLTVLPSGYDYAQNV